MYAVCSPLPKKNPLLITYGQSFFGAIGCACSIVFTTFGAAYGTAKSAGAIFQSGILRPDMMMQNTYDEMNSMLVKQWLTHLACVPSWPRSCPSTVS